MDGERIWPDEGILGTIGRTPLVRLQRLAPANGSELLAKLEMFNPCGSVKDRIAAAMVREAEASGALRAGQVMVEPTSGNTGIGLAMTAAARGYKLIIVMPENMSAERKALLRWFGAELVLTPAAGGMPGAVAEAKRLCELHGWWMPAQFDNPANPTVHYESTGVELLAQLGGAVHSFVVGVGTGGTLTGAGRRLKEQYPGMEIVAVEPAGSPVLSGGQRGPHGIQGIGAGFVPSVLDRELIDRIITVTDAEAMAAAADLARKEGVFAGISSGAAVAAAMRVAAASPRRRVLTVLPDAGDRYLSLFLQAMDQAPGS
ncbi:MAG: cysteine synthase A [Bacillota bacterium]